MAWDEDLTPEQKEVTKYTDTNACLLAGPGTGKTRCITHRVVYLIEESGVPPEEILILTFTRKAAAELRQRVKKVLGPLTRVNVFTLHSYALTQLLKNSLSHSLPKPLRIADDYEEDKIIVEDLKSILGWDKKTIKKKMKDMSSNWELLGNSDSEREPDPRLIAAWNMHRELYGYTLRSELVYQLNKAFDDQSIQPESYKHIIVDEYQDLNACDLNVIKLLASRAERLYVAGDDDQSIYSFRNANPVGIRTFTSDYPGSKELILKECMRSTPDILRIGDYVIKQDLKRKDKSTFTNKKSIKDSVKILSFSNQNSEAKKVGELCSWLVNEKGVDPDEIIILLRNDWNNNFSKPIVNALAKLNLPVTESTDPAEIFNVPSNLPADQKKLGRIFLSYLRLVQNHEDQLAWRSILELEQNGIGKATVSEIMKYSVENRLSFFETLKSIENGSIGLIQRKEKLSQFITKVEGIINKYSVETLLIKDLIKDLANQLIQNEDLQNSVIETLLSICELESNQKLEDLLKNIFIDDSKSSQDQTENKIRIMTMHQAKGLDAQIVIIIGAEKELLPGRDTGLKWNDALRLLYVSITRARDYLLITHCIYRGAPQCHSGTGQEGAVRRLSDFINGGPVKSEPGADFISNKISG